MWSTLAVALLLVATAESAAIVVLAFVVRDLQRELVRRAVPQLAPSKSEHPPRPVGFRLPEQDARILRSRPPAS